MTPLFHITRVIETHRRLLTTVALLLAGQLLAYFAAHLVIELDFKVLALIAMAFTGMAVAVRILNDWHQGLYFFPMGYNSMSFYLDFLVNAYLWILLGMSYKLPRLARSAQFALESAAARSGSPAVRPQDSWVPTR